MFQMMISPREVPTAVREREKPLALSVFSKNRESTDLATTARRVVGGTFYNPVRPEFRLPSSSSGPSCDFAT